MVAAMKPKCPDHPEASVLSARKPGDNTKQWMCMTCGKLLGCAGPVEGGLWEQQVITRDETTTVT